MVDQSHLIMEIPGCPSFRCRLGMYCLVSDRCISESKTYNSEIEEYQIFFLKCHLCENAHIMDKNNNAR